MTRLFQRYSLLSPTRTKNRRQTLFSRAFCVSLSKILSFPFPFLLLLASTAIRLPALLLAPPHFAARARESSVHAPLPQLPLFVAPSPAPFSRRSARGCLQSFQAEISSNRVKSRTALSRKTTPSLVTLALTLRSPTLTSCLSDFLCYELKSRSTASPSPYASSFPKPASSNHGAQQAAARASSSEQTRSRRSSHLLPFFSDSLSSLTTQLDLLLIRAPSL